MVTNESWKGKQKTKIRFWDLGDLGVLAFSRVYLLKLEMLLVRISWSITTNCLAIWKAGKNKSETIDDPLR